MHPFHPLLTLLTLTTLHPLQTLTHKALGINCRGSSMCTLATWQNKARVRMTQALRDAVYDSPKPNSTTYANGDHIICVSQSLHISLTGGHTSGVDAEGASSENEGSLALGGNIGNGGICLFPQGMGNGAVIDLGQIRNLNDEVLEHGCKTCGSVPIHYVDGFEGVPGGSNDPRWGILTFNYVGNPYCTGNCISANGQPWINGTVMSSGTQFARERLRRSARVGGRVGGVEGTDVEEVVEEEEEEE